LSGYQDLAHYYGILFPVSEAQKQFLAPMVEICQGCRLPWLDVGCGVGALFDWLTGRGVDARGIDPDEAFIDQAHRSMNLDDNWIQCAAMNDIDRVFPDASFGSITCLGNVLAHARDLEEIRGFIAKARRRLVAEGRLILQIVNYDRVLSTHDASFPLLRRTAPDGTALVFERRYSFDEYRPGGRIRFDTRLRIGDQTIENTAWLLPIQKEELLTLTQEVFPEVQVYGDYDKNPWSMESAATVLVASARLD